MQETAIAENIFVETNVETNTERSKLAKRKWHEVIQDYTELTKPRIIVLLLITTAGAMWIASEGKVDAFLMFITVLGGAIAAASANAINCLYDRDIDAKMERTSWRPIPSGRISPLNALIFAIALAGISFTLLTVYANLLAACLAMSGIATYVGVYTIWLKRSSTQNIVIGGAAGAIPPLVGWAAVTGGLALAPLLLFAGSLFWTLGYDTIYAHQDKDDDALIGVRSTARLFGAATKRWVGVFYALAFLLLCAAGAVAGLGLLFLLLMLAVGAHLAWQVWRLNIDDGANCLAVFRSNREVGLLVFLAIGAGCLSVMVT